MDRKNKHFETILVFVVETRALESRVGITKEGRKQANQKRSKGRKTCKKKKTGGRAKISNESVSSFGISKAKNTITSVVVITGSSGLVTRKLVTDEVSSFSSSDILEKLLLICLNNATPTQEAKIN